MKDHSGDEKCFYRYDKDMEILVGMYHPDGGTSGEFKFKWVDLGRYGIVPKLEAFNDGWHALVTEFKELLEVMASIDGENISLDEFCDILEKLGYHDLTQ